MFWLCRRGAWVEGVAHFSVHQAAGARRRQWSETELVDLMLESGHGEVGAALMNSS